MSGFKTVLVSGLVATFGLVGCGQAFAPIQSPLTGTSNGASSTAPKTTSEKMVASLSSGLSQKSSSLGISQTQIDTILSGALQALSGSSLSSSNDIDQILPVLIQGAVSGIQQAGIGNSSQQSALISAIGSTVISSLNAMTSGQMTSTQIHDIAASLFGNLTSAGVLSGNQSTVASSIINQLLSDLGSGGFNASSLTSIIENLAAGAVTGLGSSASTSTELSNILKALGTGSLSGLTSLTTSQGLESMIQTFISAFTSGANTSLTNNLGLSNGGAGSIISTLLGSLLSGMNAQATAPATTGSGTSTSATSPLLNDAAIVIGALINALH